MTKKELITLLTKFDDVAQIILAKDSEGNSFSPLSECGESIYVPDSTYSGEIHLVELTDELKHQGFSESDMYDGEDGQKAIVLWPAN